MNTVAQRHFERASENLNVWTWEFWQDGGKIPSYIDDQITAYELAAVALL